MLKKLNSDIEIPNSNKKIPNSKREIPNSNEEIPNSNRDIPNSNRKQNKYIFCNFYEGGITINCKSS